MSTITKESLILDLKKAGLKPTDTVLVHSSMKKIGKIDANVVLDALMEYFKDGLLLLPTHTWANIKEPFATFDVEKSMPCVGILPTLMLKRSNTYRSLHPTHSICAYGKDAINYIKGEELLTTPCDPKGVYGRLFARDAKILLIGVNHVKNTYIHSVEESFDVENRIALNSTPYYINDKGRVILVNLHRHYCSLHPHVSECYQRLEEAFIYNKAEITSKFGDADMIVCNARGIYNTVSKILAHEKQSLVELEEIPSSWWS